VLAPLGEGMKMKKLLSVVLTAVALVLFCGTAQSEELRVGSNLRHEKILLPNSAPDKSRLIARDNELVEGDELGLGILTSYDDPQTKLEVDYVEFYDLSGDLLLVSWIDRFGIWVIAIDRGLLDETRPRIDGVLVPLPVGTTL
jgi:hypothetical protein